MEILFSSFVLFFIVIDPIGVAAIFSALTHGAERSFQRRMAIRGTAVAAGILLAFFLFGDGLLRVLGITIPAFRVAGGALLFLLAIDMVFARHSGLRSTTMREQHEAEHREDVSVFPLAFPLIAGPGGMTTVLLMASMRENLAIFGGMLAIILFVLGLSLVALLYAPTILRWLGETGINVINRVLGLILSALAVQYILDGIRGSLIEVSGAG